MKNFACLLLISLNSILCNAQSAYQWPEDTMKAKTEWVLLKDAMQQSRYLDAKAPLEWLIKEAPDLHLSLYVYGEKLYKTLIKEQEETQEHQQALLKLFEKRLSYYKDSANVLNRKLLAYYQFYKNDADSLKNMYLEFKDYFQKYPGQMLGANIIAYMDILRLIKKSGADISDDEVFQTYDQLSLALQRIKESDDQKAKKQALLDKLLTSSVQLSCEIINSKFGQPFLAQYADDLDRAKKIIALGLAYGCKHSDAFLAAAQLWQAHKPGYTMAKMIASMLDQRDEHNKAESYYQQAIELSDDALTKAQAHLALAIHFHRRLRYSKAREEALKATKLNPLLKDAYKLIGDLYLSSFESCKKGKMVSNDRAVFVAAWHMYRKAGRKDLMEVAQQQFPTVEQLFQDNYQEGQKIKIGCWINEEVKLMSNTNLP